MLNPATEPDLTTLLLVLGAGAVSVGLLGLAGRVIASDRERAILRVLALLLLVGFVAVASALGWSRSYWLPPLALAGICAVFFAVRSPAVQRAVAGAATPSFQWGVLLLAGLPLVGLSTYRPGANPRPRTEPADDVQAQRSRAMASLQEAASPVALTDGGRRIRLHTMPPAALPAAMLQDMEAEMAREWGPSLGLLRTRPPDGRSDCHGWVFTEGNWWILGADVGAILQDNGYESVTAPAVGDLVVYWLGPGRVTHSGVVFATANGGTILVESKWAWLGTYVHPASVHPYGGRPVYYRSARAGHRLTVTPAEPISSSR
jgi:hypothetical protein